MPKGAHLRTHGLWRHPLYSRWHGMIQRCTDPNHKNFKDYGGRGVKVCESWHWFPNFLADMGTPPPGCSLERLDGDGSYSPENCEWATRSKQMRNTRNTRRIEFRGQTKCLAEWAGVVGVSERALSRRLEQWPIERALTEAKHLKGVNL